MILFHFFNAIMCLYRDFFNLNYHYLYLLFVTALAENGSYGRRKAHVTLT